MVSEIEFLQTYSSKSKNFDLATDLSSMTHGNPKIDLIRILKNLGTFLLKNASKNKLKCRYPNLTKTTFH